MEKNKLPSFVSILILTLVTVITWVGFSIYRAFSLKPAPNVPADISLKLNPNLDAATIKQIESRIFLGGAQIPEINISTASATPTIAPTSAPTATQSATSTATASATPTATP